MPTGEFLRNQWYVAATAAEIGTTPFRRIVCDEAIVLFRRRDGSIAAHVSCRRVMPLQVATR
jgi:phenylpropionate dioxygenase-like ring-hydroxylating dioxygenase large terminal subunit